MALKLSNPRLKKLKTLMIVHFPNNEANIAMFKNPKAVGERLGSTMEKINPMSAYFGEEDGERTAWILIDLPSENMIPFYAEPFFTNFSARVKFRPVMDIDDVRSGLSKVEERRT